MVPVGYGVGGGIESAVGSTSMNSLVGGRFGQHPFQKGGAEVLKGRQEEEVKVPGLAANV